MKNLASPEIDRYRFEHPMVPNVPDELRAWGGAFEVPVHIVRQGFKSQVILRCIVSRGGCPHADDRMEEANRWDHLSVSTANRCPTWEEMEFVKRLFFERDECAMQLHVPPRDHINNHEFCLHIWRPIDSPIRRPPSDMVGVPGVTGMASLKVSA